MQIDAVNLGNAKLNRIAEEHDNHNRDRVADKALPSSKIKKAQP